jgi:hypothetical protein
MGLIPIYIYEEGNELPTSGNYFVIAKNGVYMHKDVGIITGLVKVEVSDLPLQGQLAADVHFNLPPLPNYILFKALTFFRRVWHQYRAEAATVLFFNSTINDYYLHCPRQEVSGGGVRYGVINNAEDPEEVTFISKMRVEGYKRVGTIHSHCNFSAFHSGTDTSDEAKFDGLHITLGHVDRDQASMVSSLVANNNRFQVSPDTVVSGIFPVETGLTRWSDYFFDFEMSEDDREKSIDFMHSELETEWMPRVSQIQYHFKKYGGWWSQIWGGGYSPYQGYEEKKDGQKAESESGGLWRDRTSGPSCPPPSDVVPEEIPDNRTDAD